MPYYIAVRNTFNVRVSGNNNNNYYYSVLVAFWNEGSIVHW